MKLLTVVSIFLGFLTGCGVSGGSSAPAPTGIQVDQNTPAVTTGAQCAAAAQPEFKAPGKRVGISQLKPGTYTYVESRHLYIGENKTDGAVVEGHISDQPTSDTDYSLDVDCQHATGLKKEKNYSDNLSVDFASKIVINKAGDLSEPGRRFITVGETDGKFSAVGNVETSPKVVVNADLKAYDSKYSTTANKKREYWQADNGDLYIVMHSGVNVSSAKIGASSVTRDSIVHYKRSATTSK